MPNVEIEEYSFRDAYTGCAISPRPHARPLISQYHRVRTHIVPGAFARLTRPRTHRPVAKATG